MFYLFDIAKVAIFLPFTKCFCNYFFFYHYFSFYLDYIGARLHLCAIVERLEQGSTPPLRTTSPPFRHPQHPRRATAHTTASGRARAHPRPVWRASRPTPCTRAPSRAPHLLPACVRIYGKLWLTRVHARLPSVAESLASESRFRGGV